MSRTEYLRLVDAGVSTTTAATIAHELLRRAPMRGGRPRLPREHGTDRGYHQHATGTACQPCRRAHAATKTAARAGAR